ncbi:MAG: hypothetical protein R2854_28515 [Caldilineaceae bacterium]
MSDDELARRRAAWQPKEPKYTKGVLYKYMKIVSSGAGRVRDGRVVEAHGPL